MPFTQTATEAIWSQAEGHEMRSPERLPAGEPPIRVPVDRRKAPDLPSPGGGAGPRPTRGPGEEVGAGADPVPPLTAFVFGGGGRWGAVQVGMVQALLEHGVYPDHILGTSIGALNGAIVAYDPTLGGARRLRSTWEEVEKLDLLSSSAFTRMRSLVRHRVSLHGTEELRALVSRSLPADQFEDLAVTFQCVAASIELATEHWFESGSLIDAIVASSAIPGLFPPVEIGGFNYYDGGLVNSVPVDRAVALGATTIYVLQVGRVEQSLRRPTRIYEPALIAFEIARRTRFATTLASLPPGFDVHILPSGNTIAFDDRRQLRWRDMQDTERLISGAHAASSAYLTQMVGAQ